MRVAIGLGAAVVLTAAVSCQWLSPERGPDDAVRRGPEAHPDTARGAALLYGYRGSPVDHAAALKLLAGAANAGDALAIYYQGVAVSEGWGAPTPDHLRGRRLIERAYPILRQYAANGNIESLFAVGEICAAGRLNELDWGQAEPIYRYCMEQGYGPAYREMGMRELQGGRPAVAVDWLRRATVTGDAAASFYLSRALQAVGGAAAEAKTHLQTAAGLGYPAAIYEVAQRAVDPAERQRWLERAAAADYAPAQLDLALQQQKAGNRSAARYWLELAAARNEPRALLELAKGEGRRHFEVERMVLLHLAQAAGAPEAAAAIAAADADSGLAWPVAYSTLPLMQSGEDYALFDRQIQIIADDYLGGTEGARPRFSELVAQRGAVLPASLIWFTVWRRGLPLQWLAEEPASCDTLGLAIAAGLAGQGAAQQHYAQQLAAEAERRPASDQALGRALAGVLNAHGALLNGDVAAARTILATVPVEAAAVTGWINFIRHLAPVLAREPGVAAPWLGVAEERFLPLPLPVVRQPFEAAP